MIDDLPPLSDVVRRHRLVPKRSLGQNFIFDLNLTARIARVAGPLEGVTVVEVGPGPGGLTRALLAAGAKRVIAIERDERCLEALADIGSRYPNRLEVVAADALEIDLGAVMSARRLGPARVVANLPYNIGTALLVRWLNTEPWPPWFDRMTLMFQREVAERIVATPKQRGNYGRLGVLCGWRTRARILFDVPAQAFSPAPKVTSAVVELIPRAVPLACDRSLLGSITTAAFGRRRKMLRQSLKSLTVDPTALLEAAGIDGTRRAEEIDIAGFVDLARAMAAMV